MFTSSAGFLGMLYIKAFSGDIWISANILWGSRLHGGDVGILNTGLLRAQILNVGLVLCI